MRSDPKEMVLKGIPVSPGIAIGPAFLLLRNEFADTVKHIKPELVECEISSFENARQELISEMEITMRNLPAPMARIIESQIMVLNDKRFIQEVVRLIREYNYRGDFAVLSAAENIAKPLEKANSVYMKERYNEILGIAKDLINKMRASEPGEYIEIQPGTILISDDLSVKETIHIVQQKIKGVVLKAGGQTSHAAIILRDFQVPAVFGVETISTIENEQTIIVDGNRGSVILFPKVPTLYEYEIRLKEYEQYQTDLLRLRKREAVTRDGFQIGLSLNIDFPEELHILDHIEKRGIGLFRTEVLYFTGRLDEDTQFQIYQELANRVYPFKATIRAFDIGGDKLLGSRERNPFLGLRGIRVLLKERETLKKQFRAILRANAKENIRFMLPMVSNVEELVEFKQLADEVVLEMTASGEEDVKFPDIGIMVETPAAALLVEQFKGYVKFISIGTNDLTQYVMAVDRKNPRVGYLYDHLNPAVLRLIYWAIRRAHSINLPVSVCGEMASDPFAIPILIGMDVDELSLAPAYLLQTKKLIRHISKSEARELKDKILQMSTTKEVRSLMSSYLKEKFAEILSFIPSIDVETQSKGV